MAKRQHSISLSFVLLRFTVVMLCCMFCCCILWTGILGLFQNKGIVYHGSVSNKQVEKLLADHPDQFVAPSTDFLADYAVFDANANVVESNVVGKKLANLTSFYHSTDNDVHIVRHNYSDGSMIIIQWYYRSEFTNPDLRSSLPPFEYLWFGTLGVALILCLLLNTLWLRRYLVTKLKLFSEVSEKVGSQELDFTIPHAGIKEYDQALSAMERMRDALYSSLSSQWAAQQQRETEIAALAHDLKTPLTLVGGNAELLSDEELPANCRKMVQTIASSNDRAKQYVTALLETSSGADEMFEFTSLSVVFEELCANSISFAETKNIHLQTHNNLDGNANIQKNHIIHALGNVVQNAMEHTPFGGNVYLDGTMTDHGWQITVRDEGTGFSPQALHHATERLWRDDSSRESNGHNGLGLWFALNVAKTHNGHLTLSNWESGGMVTIQFH